MTPKTAVVTGAYSNIGGAVARDLLARGWQVVTLTNRPAPDRPGLESILPHPLVFERDHLRRVLDGADLLVNTYWIRFPRQGVTFGDAVGNTGTLIDAARDAGVRRLVHISVSNASEESPLAYYRGKGRVERMVRDSGLSYAVVRPTLVVGPNDVLTNNIAWLLRRLPWFGIPDGPGYALQPVTLGDTSRIVCDLAGDRGNLAVDAAGPETITFREFVGWVARGIGRPLRAWTVPPSAAMASLTLLGWVLRDTVLTAEELEGLRTNRLVSHSPPLATESVSGWLARHGKAFGSHYINDTTGRFARARRAQVAPTKSGDHGRTLRSSIIP